jgi:PAS domain S-box-containing protein
MNEVIDFFSKLFSSNGFPARWYCGNWTDFHGWLYIFSDLAIWGAYFAIPLLLFYFITRKRHIPFQPVLWLFIAFILSCGTTHLVDAMTFWFPLYRLNALISMITAVISWTTVIALIRILPQALNLKTPEELEEIIEEKTAELGIINQKLAESERLFRTLVNNNPDLITCISKDLTYKFINDSTLALRGLSASDYLGKTPYQMGYPKESIDFLVKHIHQAIETKEKITYPVEINIPPPVNEKRYYEIVIVPIKDENQEQIEDLLTVTRDITPQKQEEFAKQERIKALQILSKGLAQRNQQLEDFTHIVSHNLRTPISNLRGLIYLLEETADEEEKNLYFEKIKQVSNTFQATIEDLTEVVRIQQTIDEVKVENIRFDTVLSRLLQTFSPQILECEAQITSYFNDCSSITYSKVYLESILFNLLSNALKYRSPDRKPQIHLETKLKDDTIILTCQDNGLGLDMKRYGKYLFGMNKTFHQNKDARGVGLFITKNQIEAFGGSISAESEPDKGMKFTVCFHQTSILSKNKKALQNI